MSKRMISVNDTLYSISFVKEVDDEGNEGECSSARKTIKVDKGLKGDDKMIAVIHEVLHAYFAEYGHRDWLDNSMEEHFCTSIPKLLTKVFRITFKKETP